MAINKVLLYYCFTPIKDPEAIRLWQWTLAESLGIKGRILISQHGMNGTVGGDIKALKKYVKATKKYEGFARTDFKWSDGTGNDFPKLKVKVRKELVTFLADDEIEVDENGVVGGGVHLQPEEVNALVAERGEDVVFFDGRNAFEAKIGRFRNAVVPSTDTTRDFLEELESGKYDHLKNRPIVTYCTGGIRCEVLSVLMKRRGFEEVYQIQGGIVRYGETFKDKGLWEGSLYTFDARMTIDFSPDAQTIGQCDWCHMPTKTFFNCHDDFCIQLLLLCDTCATKSDKIDCHHPNPHGPIDLDLVG